MQEKCVFKDGKPEGDRGLSLLWWFLLVGCGICIKDGWDLGFKACYAHSVQLMCF